MGSAEVIILHLISNRDIPALRIFWFSQLILNKFLRLKFCGIALIMPLEEVGLYCFAHVGRSVDKPCLINNRELVAQGSFN